MTPHSVASTWFLDRQSRAGPPLLWRLPSMATTNELGLAPDGVNDAVGDGSSLPAAVRVRIFTGGAWSARTIRHVCPHAEGVGRRARGCRLDGRA